MATRLFFHDAASAVLGTLPTAEQSALAPSITMAGAGTCRSMDSISGVASPHVLAPTITGSGTLLHNVFLRTFATRKFDVDQVIQPQIYTLNISVVNNSVTMNFGPGMRANAYIWTPSTGTKRATLFDNPVFAGMPDPGLGTVGSVAEGSYSSSVTVTAIAGDILVTEIWSVYVPGSTASFKATIGYDGTTVNSTDGTSITSQAAFLDLATSTLTFVVPPTLGAGSISCAPATLAAAGKVALRGAGSISCATAALVGVGKVAIKGVFGATLDDATVAATGKVALRGAGSISCAAATLLGVGRVAVSAAGSISCAPATLAATGKIAITGARVQTLADVTVSATGTVTGDPVITGSRVVTLAAATAAATGVLGPAPPVPAPTLPTDSSGGSGANSARERKKFTIPDLTVEPVKTLNDILGIKEEEAAKPVPKQTLKPVKINPLAEAVAASPPDATQSSTLPNTSPVVVEEEYSDEDLMYLLLMVTP